MYLPPFLLTFAGSQARVQEYSKGRVSSGEYIQLIMMTYLPAKERKRIPNLIHYLEVLTLQTSWVKKA